MFTRPVENGGKSLSGDKMLHAIKNIGPHHVTLNTDIEYNLNNMQNS